MSRNKVFYWMKLKEDFFEDDAIQWLKEQPGGEKYALFYIELCLKSLKNNGILIRRVGDMLIPYDAERLALLTRTEVEIVVVAMELLKQAKLVEILENGEIYMSALESMVGSETNKAASMRRLRAERAGGNDVTPMLPDCYPEKEKEKEKEKEDKPAKQSFAPPSVEDVEKYCKEKGYTLIDALAFVSFYDSKGWKVGKDKMTSWKSAVAGWEARERRKQPQAATAARQAATPTANDALERRRQMMGG